MDIFLVKGYGRCDIYDTRWVVAAHLGEDAAEQHAGLANQYEKNAPDEPREPPYEEYVPRHDATGREIGYDQPPSYVEARRRYEDELMRYCEACPYDARRGEFHKELGLYDVRYYVERVAVVLHADEYQERFTMK